MGKKKKLKQILMELLFAEHKKQNVKVIKDDKPKITEVTHGR